jgi:uncharacterized membrane protein YhaH (DUF805 family)
VDLLIRPYRRAFDFAGRARRKEYWYFLLVYIIAWLVFIYIDGLLGLYDSDTEIGLFSGVFSLAILVPSVSVTIRRLHDSDHSGWWFLVVFIPLIGGLVLLYFMLLDSNPGENEYGLNPKSYEV